MKKNEQKPLKCEPADGNGVEEKQGQTRSNSLQKHIVVCPHCGAEALDHMTKCPECKCELQPKGYRPFDKDEMRKFKRVIWGVALVIAAVIVVLAFARSA